jgi:DNA-binding CsgD family transcriptional regulator
MPKRKRSAAGSKTRFNPVQSATINRVLAGLRLAEIPQSDIHVEQYLLQKLPQALGYESAADFVWAFRTANGMRSHRILTPRKMKELIRRSQAGESPRQIAKALSCATQTVCNVRVKLGITSRHLFRIERR